MNDLHTFAFFISMLLAELGGGILKCRLAAMLQNILSDRVLTVVNHVMGTILVALGLYLIISMIVRMRHPERPEKEPTEMVSHIIHQTLTNTRESLSLQKDSLQDNDTVYFQ